MKKKMKSDEMIEMKYQKLYVKSEFREMSKLNFSHIYLYMKQRRIL